MRDNIRQAISDLNPQDRRQYLIDHGMCPICGEEAAPWYLCPRHRKLASLRNILNTFTKRGLVTKTKDGRSNLFKANPDIEERWNEFDWPTYLFDMKKDDKRLRPRLGRRPVDLESTLMQIFVDSGRPLSEDEICAAWGKLRSVRKTGCLSGDMAKLIRAQRRRERRCANRIGAKE